MFTRPSRTSRRGFTLIELLTVVVIVGILAAVVVPRFLEQRDGGEDSHTANLVSVSYQDAKAFWSLQTYPNYVGTSEMIGQLASVNPEIAYTALSDTSGASSANAVGIYVYNTEAQGRGNPDSIYLAATSDSGDVISIMDEAGDVTKCGFPGADGCASGAVGAPTAIASPVASSASAVVGDTLTATTGTWSGDPTTFSYEWQVGSGDFWQPATGTGAATALYVVASADAGSSLRVCVTASNGSSSAPSCSTPVSVASAPQLWATSAGGTLADSNAGVSGLSDGSAIVIGLFNGTASFGSTTLTSAGNTDVSVAKINADGTWAWATSAGGSGADQGTAVSALSDGSAIVTGWFNGTASFGSTTLTSAGTSDAFVAKINADGTWAWATRAGGTGSDQGRGVSVLADGSAVITGVFGSTGASFDSTTLTSAGGSSDVFVAKINATGIWEWATGAGGTGNDQGLAVSALPDGSAVVTGSFNSTSAMFGTSLSSDGSGDVFVAKVGADGVWAWATATSGGALAAPAGLAVLSDGSAIVTGNHISGATVFGGTELTSSSTQEVFTAKVGTDGIWAWATNSGGTGSDFGRGVAALSDGSAIITGTFNGTALFGTTTLTSAGAGDVFAMKITPDGTLP